MTTNADLSGKDSTYADFENQNEWDDEYDWLVSLGKIRSLELPKVSKKFDPVSTNVRVLKIIWCPDEIGFPLVHETLVSQSSPSSKAYLF